MSRAAPPPPTDSPTVVAVRAATNQESEMAKHTTFTGELGARVDRLIERWLKLANRSPITIDRGMQLCRRFDRALEIAEALDASAAIPA